MSTQTPLSEPRLSELFARTLDVNQDGVVVLGEVLDRAGDRGYGFLLIFLAIPAFIPVLPPGTSGVLGVLMILVALQMLLGMKQPWFPQRWRQKVLSPKTVQALQTHGVALLRKFEKVSHPRGRRFIRNGTILRLSAIVVILLALVLSSPMPFMNTLPALGVLLIGIGLANHDIYFLGAGWLIGAIVAIITLLGVGAIKQAVKLLRQQVGL
ncbi:MAG: exopolysaccharide biosynthesis protein [Fimbriimonadales bacterium]|nr:exopolysaccharide biosynthesis protein [Fimbriimonadales bacterium]MDW8052679.1 exopolysaccharide biosynthesis protein [Armatimonadota bacterium]